MRRCQPRLIHPSHARTRVACGHVWKRCYRGTMSSQMLDLDERGITKGHSLNTFVTTCEEDPGSKLLRCIACITTSPSGRFDIFKGVCAVGVGLDVSTSDSFSRSSRLAYFIASTKDSKVTVAMSRYISELKGPGGGPSKASASSFVCRGSVILNLPRPMFIASCQRLLDITLISPRALHRSEVTVVIIPAFSIANCNSSDI